MSWSLFRTNCAVLTGPQHISRIQFSQTIANAYHQTMLQHFDLMTAGGVIINSAPAFTPLFQGILATCNQNMTAQGDVHFLQQIGKFVLTYWAGIIITGPTGIVTVTGTGSWAAPYVKQNFDFQIILNTMIMAFRSHLATLIGVYVSTVVPGVTAPWSGAMLQALP